MNEKMDDGEVELSSDHVLLPNLDVSSSAYGSKSIDSYLEFVKNTRTCTHTHTCNPPGPDAAHTHTCFHTHTQVLASEDDNSPNIKDPSDLKTRRPSGNREAVRKYREKKKAHTAYLEEEVKQLRVLNQQLVRKIQGQAILEAEVLRLRSLLLDLRGKIDYELGDFPFHKQRSTTSLKESDCRVESTGGAIGLQCETDMPCFHPLAGPSSETSFAGSRKIMVSWEGNCQPAIIDCQANATKMTTTEGHTLDAETLASAMSHVE